MPAQRKTWSPEERAAAMPDVRALGGADVYVGPLSKAAVETLEAKGYRVRWLPVMPRTTDDEIKAYLLAKAQALGDGLYPDDEQTRKALELEMRAYGLLDQKREPLKRLNEGLKELTDILKFDESRHMTQGQDGSVKSVRELLKAVPGGKAKRKA